MIHLYCGDGKGKTTCAFGLALRQAGRGKNVVIAQFLKGSDSGERLALEKVPGVKLLPVPEQMKFTFAMTQAEKARTAATCAALLADAKRLSQPGGMIVLDEVCGAISTGMLTEKAVLEALEDCGNREVVLTGRDPSPGLLARADYITEMKKVRHPYDSGTPARKGIEW